MENGLLLEVRELRREYGGLLVLDRVSFSLSAGEAVGVVGPNGSGKSTLLRCVVGSDVADDGEVLLEGAVLREESPSARAALATLLDDVDFFPDLSVLEHLSLYAWAHGAESADRTVTEVLHELDLVAARDQLPATLSSGQRHRLGLAACLVRPRRVLVLDEPEQRLDIAGRAWLTRRLDDEKSAGTGILFASHDGALLDAIADRRVEVGT